MDMKLELVPIRFRLTGPRHSISRRSDLTRTMMCSLVTECEFSS